MTRSKDLDTIAPDDLSVKALVKSDEVVQSQPPKKNKIKKEIKKPIINQDFDPEFYNILGHSKSPFSAFLVHPKVLTFSEQDNTEKIYLAARPHWANNLPWITLSTLMIFVPLFFKYFTFLNFFPIPYRLSALLFWYIITFIYAFERFLSWYFNLFLVTNQRVVDIDFNNLLNKHFATADLEMIQDTSSSVRGIFGTFFNFGDVLIQTASEKNQIRFEKVPNPEKIIKLLEELSELEEQKKGDQNNE
jgi:hypothetical protein